ncbi:nuclear transport factor 2 family protein [Nocardia transvalensis]|uniref:nuclear transport factor 2 family protein n=1 Tax=Nocardia transvalensis TaxID=37333 RepID=UPI0018941C0B|nr:nuclear transport factor 2 family protein [Nocardia transvalensis]MBF6334118.1 nuclear transport factor 2 family protein [Nocardia transvalensis]
MERAEIDKVLDLYFDCMLNQNMEAAPLADDITFEGPAIPLTSGRDAVLPILVKVAEVSKGARVREHARLIDGDEGCLLLDIDFADGTHLALADYFRFRDGRIVHVQPYFDMRVMEKLWGAVPGVSR